MEMPCDVHAEITFRTIHEGHFSSLLILICESEYNQIHHIAQKVRNVIDSCSGKNYHIWRDTCGMPRVHVQPRRHRDARLQIHTCLWVSQLISRPFGMAYITESGAHVWYHLLSCSPTTDKQNGPRWDRGVSKS